MSKRYVGNIITENPTAPSGKYQYSSAPGIWTLAEALAYKKADLWPTFGRFILEGQDEYTTPGTYTWTCPFNVEFVSVVAIGGGASGCPGFNAGGVNPRYVGGGGSGGGLGWTNDIPVVAGVGYTVVVGAGGAALEAQVAVGNDGEDSSFNTNTVIGRKGRGGTISTGPTGGGFVGDGGGNGGSGGDGMAEGSRGGGGGAGGYSGNGGNGTQGTGTDATGGGGGGGAGTNDGGAQGKNAASGGGVGILGEGTSGTGSAMNNTVAGGTGGSGGTDGGPVSRTLSELAAGVYGGGSGGGSYVASKSGSGGGGAVRIIYGVSRQFPATNTGNV